MRLLMEEPMEVHRFAAASHRLIDAIEESGFEVTVVTATGRHDMETPFLRVKPNEVDDDE